MKKIRIRVSYSGNTFNAYACGQRVSCTAHPEEHAALAMAEKLLGAGARVERVGVSETLGKDGHIKRRVLFDAEGRG